jgi:hypothetical protein
MAGDSLPVVQVLDLRSRPNVKVRALQLDGTIELITLWNNLNLRLPRMLLTLEIVQKWFPTDAERQMESIRKSEEEREATIRAWIMAQPQLWPCLLKNVTDLTPEQVAVLPLPDIFQILSTAIILVDIASLLEVGRAFFTALGGLTEGFGEMTAAAKASLPGEAE